ncbi:MAG TPA: amino acid ABC transporter substrate-binding protein [Ktedonobacterales bacterium]
MIGRGSTRIHRLFSSIGILASLVLLLAGCSLGGGGTTSTNTSPITIGISLSLSGDFSADGQAFQQGYQLWADYTNAHGGLLGRKVVLKILSDASDPQQVTTNYQTLINTDHVDLIFGPFSTLLTKPASVIANRYGYALVEGAGGGPSVFQRGLNNVFDVSLPVANNLVAFANYIASLPAAQRPTTAAYATEDDPFTQPQVDTARGILEKAGIQTVYNNVYPAETTDYTPIADAIISSKAQVVVTGTLLNDIAAFINDFKQQHYNPQALVATAGPDQGTQFLDAIGGAGAAEGVLVPNGWWPDLNAPQNATMVQAYLAKYGGDKSGISSDVAEAWSVGQVVQQAVESNQSLDQAKLIATLHSGTFQSCQGPVKFDSTGQNTLAQGYLFQWQSGKFIPVYPANVATSAIQFPKANWS